MFTVRCTQSPDITQMIAYILHEPQFQHSSSAIDVELYSSVKRGLFSSYESVFIFRIPLLWDVTLNHGVIGYRRFQVPFMVTAVH